MKFATTFLIVGARGQAIIASEFKNFFRNCILIPCQILNSGRRLIFRCIAAAPAFVDLVMLSEKLRDGPRRA